MLYLIQMPNKHVKWLFIALFGAILAAPNGLLVKQMVGHVDPFMLNGLRFALVALVCAPFVWRERRRLNAKSLRTVAAAGLYIAVAVSCFVEGVKLSQASYAAIVLLITPIVLLIYSVKLYGERMSHRAVAGISLAAFGAMLLVVLPVAMQGGGVAFYPAATVLLLINCLSYPIALLQLKKANEMGVSMVSLIGLSSFVVAAFSLVLLVTTGSSVSLPSGWSWFGVVYSGLAVALIGRMCKVWSYEHIGAAATSAVMYLEIFLAILLPVFVLHEHIAVGTVVGGTLVLLGVYLVESHKLLAHRHHHFWRSH